jgi:hypothetical protein
MWQQNIFEPCNVVAGVHTEILQGDKEFDWPSYNYGKHFLLWNK